MPETLDIQREWASTLKTLLKTRGQITTQLDRHLVNTGRAADPDIADDAVAASSRAHREDMVQNLVADRSEISANVAFTETEAALNPKGQHMTAVAAHNAATVRKVKADKAVVDAQAASTKLKNPTPAQTADQNAVLADALAEQAAAIAAIPTALAAIAPAEAKVAARKLVIDARVAARSQHLRDSADTSDPAVRAAKKRALIAHDANLTDAAAEAMVTPALQADAERSFYASTAAPLLLKERAAAAAATRAAADAAAAALVVADQAVADATTAESTAAQRDKAAKMKVLTTATSAQAKAHTHVLNTTTAAAAAATLAANAPTPPELRARAEQRLREIEIEQLIGEQIEQRIATEVDQMAGGTAQRIVHPMTRVREIEHIVAEVAAEFGYTNLAHFISRHGAPRHNPDAGQTTLGASPQHDAISPETIRAADDAAARVITGVGPDQAEYDAAARAKLIGARSTGKIQVRAADGSALPDETIAVPLYDEVGGQVASASSQHASAKAALFMLDEAAAQAARFARANPHAADKNFTVMTGTEDIDGQALGTYPEAGGLGAAYTVDESTLKGAAELLKENKTGATPLSQDTIEARRLRTTKVVGAQSSESTEIPDALHGGFNLMTLFTKSTPRPTTVVESDQKVGNAARELAKAAFMAGVEADPTSAVAEARARVVVADAAAVAFRAAFPAWKKAKQAFDGGDAAAAAEVAKHQPVIDAAGLGADIPSMFDKVAARKREVDIALADAMLLANVEGEKASVAAQTLASVNGEARQAALDARHAEGSRMLAAETAKAAALRTTADEAQAMHTAAAQAADAALVANVAAPQQAAVRAEVQALAATAARAQAGKAAADRQLQAATGHLADVEAMAEYAPAQAAVMLAKAQDALAAAQQALVDAAAARDRIAQLIAAGTHADTPRLQEERRRADAVQGHRQLELQEAENARAQVAAAQALAVANQAVGTARRASEQAAAALAKTPDDKTKAAADAAAQTLAARRADRDTARAALAAHVGPGHPMLADAVEDAVLARRTASDLSAAADAAAAQADAPLQARLTALVPGGDPAAKQTLLAAFGTAQSAAADLLAAEAAAQKARAVQDAVAEQLQEVERDRQVLVRGEAAVLAEELAQSWAPQPAEAPAAYEQRMDALRKRIDENAADALAANQAAAAANAAAQQRHDKALADAAARHARARTGAAALATQPGQPPTLEQALALQEARAAVAEAQRAEAAATRARDEAKKVSDRLAAELATRATLDLAHSDRARAEAASRIAGARAAAAPSPALAKAAAVADRALLIATRTAELADAKAALDTAALRLSAAQGRYDAGKLAFDTAAAKAEAARSDAEKKLVAAWPAVEARLAAVRTREQSAYDTVRAGPHADAVLALAAAEALPPV